MDILNDINILRLALGILLGFLLGLLVGFIIADDDDDTNEKR